MDLLQAILNARNGQAVDTLGQHVGLDRDQTVAALQKLVPALAGGFANNATAPGGLDRLTAALASGGHQQYLDQPATLADPASIQDGNSILGHLLGSKDVSREVAGRVSSETGIGAEVIKRMLPMVAALAMGALSRHTQSPASLGRGGASGGGLMDMIAPMLQGGGGGLGGLLGGLMGRR
jgi:hypothetical protein